ncbi:hypothetical protein J5N97_026283 [Dioscorea zingiberensis]|uniref:Uncharacterized protein n=1 Tax=Dioscorea zingiberensis TaxID=325984 RepID=A0A9D5H6M6_9LILI|nr:hypothetical protein J5N97_026283 [Dioscorea zingiberensis]
MDPGRTAMSRGGERLEEVIGRGEDDEMPKFEAGAFEIELDMPGDSKVVDKAFLDRYLRQGQVGVHTMRSLLDSIRAVEPGKLGCSLWIEEPTVLVTRFEYANLFHTVTDWYSVYVSSRITGLQLEETWEALFLLSDMLNTSLVQFVSAMQYFHPWGNETALFKGLSEQINRYGTSANILHENPDDTRTARLSEFEKCSEQHLVLWWMACKQNHQQVINVLFVQGGIIWPIHGILERWSLG